MKEIYINNQNRVVAIINSDGIKIAITNKAFKRVHLPEELAAKKQLGDKLTKEEIKSTIEEKHK